MRKLPMTLTAVAAMLVAGSVQAQEPYPQEQQQQQQQQQQHAEQDSVVGQVVEASENELTLRTEDGRSMTFKVDERTRVTDPAGRAEDAEERDRIEDLRTGENVVVRYREGDREDEKVAVAVEIRDDHGPGMERQREEGWQDRQEQRQEREREHQERDRERDWQERQQQERQQPQERQEMQREQQIQGQVVEANENELTIRTDDGRSMTFLIDDETEVSDPTARAMDDEERERVEDLRQGERVTVSYRQGDTPTEHKAVSVEIRGADGQQQQMQQRQQQQTEQQRQQQQTEQQRQQQQTEQQRQQQQTEQQRQQQQMQEDNDELPRTSSNLPLVALMGVIGMMAAAGAATFAYSRG